MVLIIIWCIKNLTYATKTVLAPSSNFWCTFLAKSYVTTSSFNERPNWDPVLTGSCMCQTPYWHPLSLYKREYLAERTIQKTFTCYIRNNGLYNGYINLKGFILYNILLVVMLHGQEMFILVEIILLASLFRNIWALNVTVEQTESSIPESCVLKKLPHH